MIPGPITSSCMPPEPRERFSKWVVRVTSRDSRGKPRLDLDEYFSDGMQARAFFEDVSVGDEMEWADTILIARISWGRFDDEYLSEFFKLTGEDLRSFREQKRKEKEAS